MNTTPLKCENCGSVLNLDLNNISAFCPYCGQKLLIDSDTLIVEKEKTRRMQISYDRADRKKQEEIAVLAKAIKVITITIIVLVIIMVIADKIKNPN